MCRVFEGNPARPKARVLVGAGYLSGELGTELAPYRRHIHANLLEHAPAQQRHDAAAALGPGPRPTHEPPGREPVALRPAVFVLEPLERGADAIAQRLEPGARALAQLGQVG
jgi:hypothetical protein